MSLVLEDLLAGMERLKWTNVNNTTLVFSLFCKLNAMNFVEL